MANQFSLPDLFSERLARIIPKDFLEHVHQTFLAPKSATVRINSLKTDVETLINYLNKNNIHFLPVPWCPQALILENISTRDLSDLEMVREGKLYLQGLTSIFVSQFLAPTPKDTVLDLCAAPGSKASHMAALMQNQGQLVCVEAIRPRFYRLKSVLSLLGVSNASLVVCDGRRYRPKDIAFDKILVDAPCSSEGRFHVANPKSFAYWSTRKIKEMVRKQRGLLLNASRLLKPGGVLLYVTCTFAPEENEGVLDWLLRKTGGQLMMETMDVKGVDAYPTLLSWEGKEFHPDVQKATRLLPTLSMDGFFIAKLRKKE